GPKVFKHPKQLINRPQRHSQTATETEMLGQKHQPLAAPPPVLPPPVPPQPPPPAGAVDGNEWGLNEADIEALFVKMQVPPKPPVREPTVLPPSQVELTEEDRLSLARIQQREAEGRVRKTTRSSELQPAVVGHNKSEEKQTQRLLRQWFFEERYQLDKVNNAQRATYRQLRQLHVDRRRQVRELMNYRREEARAEVQRERDRQQRAKELALLEKQMEKLREVEALEKRLGSPEEDQVKLPPVKKRKAKAATTRETDAALSAIAAATMEAAQETEVVNSTSEEIQNVVDEQPPKQDIETQEEVVTMTSKVVEVERRGMQAVRQGSDVMTVLERSRSKSFIRESTGLKAAPASQQQPESTTKQQMEQQPAPTKPISEPKEKLKREQTPPPPPPPPPPLPQIERPPLTQVEKNRLRAKRREEASKKLLHEPYTHYRMVKGGSIEPVEFQPPKFPTTEPSNRPLYEQHKRLEREKANYMSSMNRLGQFTAEVLNEEIRLAQAFEMPKEKENKSRPPKEMKLGPSDWMKVFIRTNAPEDVESGSFEAMKYVEYLRPEAPNTNRDIEPEKLFDDA
ncbi:hypothetical protein BOX15_Mlig030359g1, partial [Macrostomum lignano]